MNNTDRLMEYFNNSGFILNNKVTSGFVYQKGELKFNLIDQRFDGVEVWLITEEKEKKIRLDYILEYYLTSKVDLVNKHLREPEFRDEFGFYSTFITKHFNELAKKDFVNTYNEWYKSNDFEKLKIKSLLI